jgi:putative sterol carrier protein
MKDTLISVGLLAAGGVAIAAASGVYSKGSRALGSEDLRLESEAGLDKGSRSGINVNDMVDEGRRTYSAGDTHVHVWLDLGVARDDRGNKVPKSGEWQVICSTSPDPLNLSPRGSELERETFRFADPKQRELVAMSANDYIRGLLFRHRGKGSAARAALTLDQVQAGDRVTIRDRLGHESTGRAVAPSAHSGWILHMDSKDGVPFLGGLSGTYGALPTVKVADEHNFVRAKRSMEPFGSAARAALTLDQVQAGDRVTIRDRFGHEHTGRAVMRSSHGGWVLNMGGAHGTGASSGRADWLAGEGSAARAKVAPSVRITPEVLLQQIKAIPGVSSAHVSDTWPEDGFVQISVVLKTHGKISVATEARGRYQDLYQIPDYAKVSAAVRAAVNASGMPVDGVEGLKKVYAYLDPRYSHHGEKREGGFPYNTMVVAVYGEPKGSRATRFGKGSMTRDGSYEATLMFDADEDDPSVRAQRQLQENPYVPQARPLTADPQRITSAQEPAGSAARGVTDGYVEDYLNGENIAISTFLSRNLRGKAKSYSGQYARRMTAALEALVASGEVYRDTTPKGAASYRRATSAQEPAGSAARGVTDGYVEDYLNGENIAISTFLSRSLRGKAKSYSGQYARRMTAALEALVASGEVYRDTTPKGAASYRRASTAGSAARGSSSVLTALTSKPKPPIPGPSLKTLDDRLNLGGEEGKSLKHFMQVGQRKAALDYANQLLDGNGIEYIPSEQDTMRSRAGLEFVNMGDTYDTTLIYDFSTRRFYVGAWGDWVERYPKRFG